MERKTGNLTMKKQLNYADIIKEALILDSRAAVYVQLGLISIAYYHVRRRDYSVTA